MAAAKGPVATHIDSSDCGHPRVIRYSRRGPFLGCSHYPACKNTSEVPAKLLEELGLDGNGKEQPAPLSQEGDDPSVDLTL
jgi:ssDNA-binding Zn-finger/Zn-ribbon topoisomerase 1